VGLGAFVAAATLDLATKAYIVHSGIAGDVVYNGRPHNLAIRLWVSLLTIAVVYLLEHVGRRRGLGRLWGAWMFVGVLVGGTLANGVSSYLWARGVPDFIRMHDGWVWNLADFEIALGLLGTALSIIASAVLAVARTRWSRRRQEAALADG
jgi:uncharacterized SAM-binding protein YcdF (DUF218 family)